MYVDSLVATIRGTLHIDTLDRRVCDVLHEDNANHDSWHHMYGQPRHQGAHTYMCRYSARQVAPDATKTANIGSNKHDRRSAESCETGGAQQSREITTLGPGPQRIMYVQTYCTWLILPNRVHRVPPPTALQRRITAASPAKGASSMSPLATRLHRLLQFHSRLSCSCVDGILRRG